jgi:hypothetical protein
MSNHQTPPKESHDQTTSVEGLDGATCSSKYSEPGGSKERIEEQLRIALDGHACSELWGEHVLIAAPMRCVYGYEKLENALKRIADYNPDTMSGFECRDIARDAISQTNAQADL